MNIAEIDRWCDLYEECLRGEVPQAVEEFLNAQKLPQDPSLIAELRRLYSEYYPTVLDKVVHAFAAGDYAEVIRASDSETGPWTTVETARLRLIAFQRLEQHKMLDALSRNLLDALAGEPFEQALIKLILGRLTRDDVLRMAKNSTERCKALYFVAAGIRTQLGFEAARRTLNECAQTDGDFCVEQMLARKELDVASASHAALSVPTWKAGELIAGTYHVHSTNTDGAMSMVYFATHAHWGVELALKIPRPEVLAGSDAWERLCGEANTWVKLGVHPNIVTAFYARRIGRIPAIVMEKVDGGSVKDALNRGQIGDLSRILDIAIQVARGLVYASEKIPDFVHRDLKPANVLLTSDGTAKIADFGLANAFGTVAGTPAYMAPEMWVQPDSANSATDIYSFGAMLFELLTGRRPFGQAAGGQFTAVPDSVIREARLRSTVVPNQLAASGDADRTADLVDSFCAHSPPQQDPITSLMLAHLHQPPTPPVDYRSDIPSDLSSFCLRLLEKDPKKRPSAIEVVSTLTAIYEVFAEKSYPRDAAETADLLTPTLNNHALSMIDLGREEDALFLWSQANDTDPLDAAVAYNTGLLAWRKGELTDSDLLDRLENIAANHFDPPSISYLKALIHLERGDHTAVLESLNGINGSMIASEVEIASLRRTAQEKHSSERNRQIEIEAHRGKVSSVRLNANGTKAITSGDDKTIRFWEADPDFRGAFVGYHEAPISAMDVADDWSAAVSIDSEGVLRCWKVATGICTQTIETGHKVFGLVKINSSTSFCFCLTGNGGPQKAMPELWDTQTGRRIMTFKGLEYGCYPVLLSIEKDLIAAADSKTLMFWQLSTGKQLHCQTINDNRAPSRPFLFDENGGRFIAPRANVDVAIISCRSSRILQTFHGHKDAVFGLAGPAELTRFASYDAGQTVRLWDVQRGRCFRTFEVADDPVTALAVSADGQRMSVGKESGKVSIFNWPDLSFIAPFVLSRPIHAKWLTEVLQGVRKATRQAQAQIDEGDFIAAAATIDHARNTRGCGRHPKLLATWYKLYTRLEKRSLRSVWRTRTINGHNTFIQSLRLCDNGERLLSVSRDGMIRMTDITTSDVKQSVHRFENSNPEASEGRTIEEIREMMGAAHTWAADISRNGKCAAVASGNGRIRLWDTSTGKNTGTIDIGTSKVLAVHFINNADRVASGCADGTVSIHDVQTTERIHLLQGHTDAVTAIALTHDGRRILTTGDDQTIRIWDPDSGQCLSVFGDEESGPLVPASVYNHRAKGLDSSIRALTKPLNDYTSRPLRLWAERVRSICVDHTGTLALRSIGTRLELWNLNSTTLIRSIEAHEQVILAADMTPDGRFAISAGADLRIYTWSLASGERQHSLHTTQEPWSVCLSRDGRYFVSGEFGQIVQWTLDWNLIADITAANEDETAAPVDPSPQEDSANLIALIDQFLDTSGTNKVAIANRIAECPWNQVRAIQPILRARVPALVECLNPTQPDAIVCDSVSYLLSATGAAAVEQLRIHLNGPSLSFRKRAIAALGRIGAASEPAIPDLLRLFGTERECAVAASYSLFSIGPQSIPHLCRALEHIDENVRKHALFTLSLFGPMATGAVQVLEKMISREQDRKLCLEAARVLNVILNPESAKRDSAAEISGRGLCGCLVVLACLTGLIWWGLAALSRSNEREYALEKVNSTAEHNIRHAKDILRMWTSGVRLNSRPSMLPEQASRYLDWVTSSEADEQIRDEARKLQQAMQEYNRYFAFANQISQFVPHLRDLDPFLDRKVAGQGASEYTDVPFQMLKPDFLILTMPFEISDQGSDPDKGPLLDAEMIKAIGEKCATVPEKLGTIIILQWHKAKIGEQYIGFEGGRTIGQAIRYRFGCIITAIAMPSRKVVFSKEVRSSDSEKLILPVPQNVLQFHESPSADGQFTLREIVKQELVKMCSARE